MPKQIIVTLGGREYTIKTLPIRQSRKWREKLAGPFGELVDVLEGAGTIELNSWRDIAGLVRVLSGRIIGSVDLILDLLFDYSPELRADQEWIEENAYDEEAMAAFVEVLKLAYPFGKLRTLVSSGLEKMGTS